MHLVLLMSADPWAEMLDRIKDHHVFIANWAATDLDGNLLETTAFLNNNRSTGVTRVNASVSRFPSDWRADIRRRMAASAKQTRDTRPTLGAMT